METKATWLESADHSLQLGCVFGREHLLRHDAGAGGATANSLAGSKQSLTGHGEPARANHVLFSALSCYWLPPRAAFLALQFQKEIPRRICNQCSELSQTITTRSSSTGRLKGLDGPIFRLPPPLFSLLSSLILFITFSRRRRSFPALTVALVDNNHTHDAILTPPDAVSYEFAVV